MAYLPEQPEWTDGVYQLEKSDPVRGGVDGPANRPLIDLLKRTAWLKQRYEEAFSGLGWAELGEWAVGLEVTTPSQIVHYQGYWYRYGGSLPHTITGASPSLDDNDNWFNLGNDVSLRANLGSDEADLGGALVSIDNATMRELAENNIFRKMTRADINTMLNTPGAEVDVEYALQVLIDEGHKSILFPHDVKGIYILAGNVTVPAPVTLISFSPCVKPYTITDDSSFLNKGAVIRKAAGADYIFGPGTVPRFYGLLLDGRDSSRPLFNQENQQRGGILFNCGIYRFLYGIGSYSYTSVQVGMSSICANQDGAMMYLFAFRWDFFFEQ
ncbi:putative prophage endo-N-neuraminidase [Klebsiella pneumoniae]|nr:putative prophage endo-N-neuraminidase [Klebsiella pneumoniae]